MAAVATASGVHEATGTLVVTTGAGQVTVSQLLPAAAVCGEQFATATLVELLLAQVVVVQLLPVAAVAGVHEATGTLLVLLLPHVVAVQLLPELAAMGVQLLTPVGPVVTGAGQVVEV